MVGSAASRSDMHPSRKRSPMTEEQLDYSGQSYKYKREVRALKLRAAEAAAEEIRRVYVLVLKGGDAEEFRRVYVLKKMFDKWSEAVLGYSWWTEIRERLHNLITLGRPLGAPVKAPLPAFGAAPRAKVAGSSAQVAGSVASRSDMQPTNGVNATG